MAKITIRKTLGSTIDNTTSSQYVSFFVDGIDNKLKYKDNEGNITILQLQNEDTVTVTTATYDVLESDRNILCNNSAALTITIPTDLLELGRNISIIDINDPLVQQNITIETEGSETINGDAAYVIDTKFESVTLISDGTNWFIKNN